MRDSRMKNIGPSPRNRIIHQLQTHLNNLRATTKPLSLSLSLLWIKKHDNE